LIRFALLKKEIYMNKKLFFGIIAVIAINQVIAQNYLPYTGKLVLKTRKENSEEVQNNARCKPLLSWSDRVFSA
jgi:hypothetical protein